MTATAKVKAEVVPIDSIHRDPANLRRHPERNLDAIKASLARFGQVKPIVVDAKGIIRAGNGTHAAARALGWPEIAVIRTDLAGPEAIAYSITDNRTTDLSTWDDTVLAETLRSLQSEDFPIEAAGFTDGEVDALIAGLAADAMGAAGVPVEDPDGEWGGMPECENEDQTSFRSLHVHFANEDDVRRFGEAIGQAIPPKAPSIWFPARLIEHPSRAAYADADES